MKIYGKISAQPHPTLCIQFLNRENNDKNNTFPLGKQICFTIVWGCAETLPNLPEIMSSKGKDNRRISGLAKPLADCKIEVRFQSTHRVLYAEVVRVVNTRICTFQRSQLQDCPRPGYSNAGTRCCYGLQLGIVPFYAYVSFSEYCSY